jgi:hypothetical protein
MKVMFFIAALTYCSLDEKERKNNAAALHQRLARYFVLQPALSEPISPSYNLALHVYKHE